MNIDASKVEALMLAKFAKVMFSQVFVCPRGGGLCPGRVSVQRGGVSVQVVSVQRGISVQRGSLSRGDLCPGGLCPGGLCPGGSLLGVTVRGPPYGKEHHWNEFLFLVKSKRISN